MNDMNEEPDGLEEKFDLDSLFGGMETPEEVGEPEVDEFGDTEEDREQAKRFGWKPKEQWKGDQSTWNPAHKFNDYADRFNRHETAQQRANAEIEKMRADLEQQKQAYQDFYRLEAERAAQSQLEDYKRQINSAMADGDEEKAQKVLDEMSEFKAQELKQPEPQKKQEPSPQDMIWQQTASEWAVSNQWINDPNDPRAKIAGEIYERRGNKGPYAVFREIDNAVAAYEADKSKAKEDNLPFARTNPRSVRSAPATVENFQSDGSAYEKEMISLMRSGTVYRNSSPEQKAKMEKQQAQFLMNKRWERKRG